MIRIAWAWLALSLPLFAQLNCRCDPAMPESLKARECSLCAEIERQPVGETVVFLKDINPRKPNRWLALPRVHTPGLHSLESIDSGARTALWSGAIDKGKSLWGDRWAIAMNGARVRTQCHMHVHIGRLLEGVETSNFVTV